MQLPRLNTEGNDQTNTLLAIDKMRSGALDDERKKKENTLLDIELEQSPATIAFIKADRAAKLANSVAQHTKANLENNKIAAGQIKAQVGSLYKTLADGNIQGYTDEYNRLKAIPELAGHINMLPDPSEYMQDDISNPTFTTIVKEKRKRMLSVLENQMAAADRVEQGLTNKWVPIYFPDGTSEFFSISVNPQKPGQKLSAEEVSKIPGASFQSFEKKTSRAPVKVMRKGKPVWEDPEKAVGQEATESSRGKDTESADRKTMLSIDEDFQKLDKDDNVSYFKTNKEAGALKAKTYNELAEKNGDPERYVWKEDAYGKGKGAWEKVKEFFGVDSEAAGVGGYVKEEVGETPAKTTKKTEAVKDNTAEEIKGMKSGDIFTWGGKKYQKR